MSSRIALKTPLLFAASAGAVCLWALAFVVSRRRPADHRAVLLHVWGLAATTVVVTLLQYTKRPYAHYALLTLPFALVTITLAGLWSFGKACSPSWDASTRRGTRRAWPTGSAFSRSSWS